MGDDLERLKEENAALRGIVSDYGEDVDTAIATYKGEDADDDDDNAVVTPPATTTATAGDLNELTDAELLAEANKAGAAGDWAKSMSLKGFLTNRQSGMVVPQEPAAPSPYESVEDGDLSTQIAQAEREGMDFSLPADKRQAAWDRSNSLKGEQLRRLMGAQQ